MPIKALTASAKMSFKDKLVHVPENSGFDGWIYDEDENCFLTGICAA